MNKSGKNKRQMESTGMKRKGNESGSFDGDAKN